MEGENIVGEGSKEVEGERVRGGWIVEGGQDDNDVAESH